MCGIAGFTQFAQPLGTIDTLRHMGNAIFHRGPDAGGEFMDGHCGLAHRRLAIIDLSEAGNQPMYSANGNLVIAFNGEIYNFLELREELAAAGHTFRTHTDTEVILALYEKMGEKCLDRLNGMFAFAIWDKLQKKLFLARDRLGKKPLYYTQKDGDIVFASEIKAILTLQEIPRNIRLDALYDFFAYQYVPDPKTIFADIHKLPAGHFMWISKDSTSITKYWDVSFSKTINKSKDEISHDLLGLINQCTKQRMVSDVPLGAFLSGGIDSSGIVALMATNSDKPIKTCSIGFDEKRFNETEFAKIVADKYKTDHHVFTVHQNVRDNLENIVRYFDEPFADPSLVPTYFVSELAKKEVTVAIAGDGGDELFAGYSKYAVDATENRLRDLFPRWIRKTIFPALAWLLSRSHISVLRKGKSLLTSLSLEPDMAFYLSNASINDQQWHAITKPATRKLLGDYHPSKLTTDFYHQADGPDHLSKILYTDIKTYLCGDILVKVDRMSMANSLEVRAPLLDKDVVEFAATLSSDLKFYNGEKKYILKETFKKLLPDEILYRKKMGFSVPLASWLRVELRDIFENYVFNKPGGIEDYFDIKVIRKLWEQHLNAKADHATLLWNILMFQMWWQNYMADFRKNEAA